MPAVREHPGHIDAASAGGTSPPGGVALLSEHQLRELIADAVERAQAPPGTPWRTAEQLAEYLGVSVATINRRVREGLPFARLHKGGRRMFYTPDVDAWLRRQ
jgi:excisionase family DNA binding protein